MKSHRFFQRSRLGRGLVWFMTLQVMLLQCIPAFALPSGEQVTHGSATFVRDGNQLIVNQASGKAIVNYNSFDIDVLETVQFAQPGATASILNRVVGGSGSQIAGSLLANGNVYLINPNGILFSASANVNVGGLVASALPMSDSDFLSGRLFFSGSGGAVINEGSLAGNFIYLIGNQVENRGSISSPDVILAAGQNSVLIDNAAGGEIRLIIDGEDEAEPIDDGAELAEAVEEDPVDESAADEVADAAADPDADAIDGAADAVADTAATEIDNTVAEEDTTAETLIEQLADLLLAGAETETAGVEGATAAVTETDALAVESLMNDPILSDWDVGTVINEGVIDASGAEGGSIVMAGTRVGQLGEVNADGEDGSGGSITIHATDTAVLGNGSTTTANAGRNGDGGEIIVVGERSVRVASTARVEAKGGTESGDGGFVETSGLETFEIGASPDVSAGKGENGTWLIDPYNIEIVAGASTNVTTTNPFMSTNTSALLDVGLIITALGSGNVTIETGSGGAEDGDITLTADLDYDGTGANLLSLLAHNDIIVNGSISDSVAGGDALSLDVMADSDGIGGGSIVINNSINTGGGTFTATGGDFSVGAAGSVDSGAGDISVTVANLISIGGDLTTTGDAMLTTTGGGIVDAGGTVTADGLALRASTGIGSLGPIQTAVNTLSAQNGASGVIRIDNDNGGALLTVGTVDGLSGINNAGDGIIVENSSPLTIMNDVVDSGGGDIRLTANGNTAADDLTLLANVTASGGNGSIFLTAGDGISHLSGNVSATAAGGVTYNASTGTAVGAITMGGGSIQSQNGNITFNAGGNIALQTVTTVGTGNIIADSSTLNVTFAQDVVMAGGNLDVDAGNAISMQGIATGGGTIDLDAGGTIDVAGAVDSQGAAVTANAGGTILFSGTIDSGALTASNSVGSINFQGDIDTAGGTVMATSTGGSTDFRNDLNTGGGNVAVTAGADAVFNSLGGLLTTSNGSVTVVAGNNATFTRDVDTGGGAFDVSATNDVVVMQALDTSRGNVDVTAGNDALFNTVGGGLNTSSGAVTVVAGNDARFVRAVDSAGGDVDVSAGNHVDMLQSVATTGGDLRLLADADTDNAGDITVLGAVTSGSGAVNAVGANVAFNGTLDSGGGNVAVTSTVGSIDFAAVTTASGDLTADAATDLTMLGAVNTGGGAIDALAGNDININAGLNTAGGALSADAGNDINSSAAVDTAGGPIDYDAVNNIVISGTMDSGSGSIDLAGGNLVQVQNTIDTMNADVGITGGTVSFVGLGDVETQGGNLAVTSTTSFVTLQNVDTGGGDITVDSAAAANLNGTVASGGGTIDLVAATAVGVNMQVTSGGGDVVVRGDTFNNVAGAIDTGTGAAGTGGAIDIAMNNGIVIGDLSSGAAGVDGGSISVVSSNLLAAAGALVVNGTVSSQDGSGGTLTIGGGTTLNGSVSVGAGDVVLDGGGLDLFLNSAQNFDADTLLIARRDIVVTQAITTSGGSDLTLEADTDGIVNSGAFGGVEVSGAGLLDSSGFLVLKGSELLSAGGAPASVILAGAANTAAAAGNILILGKPAAPAGSNVELAGAVTSTGGDITVLSQNGVEQDAAITTSGGTIDVEALNGDVLMGGVSSSASAGGNIRYAASNNVASRSLDAGTGSVSMEAGNSILGNGVITADEVRLSAANEIGGNGGGTLNTMAGVVAASAGTGGIELSNSGALEIGTAGPVTVNRVQMDGTSTPSVTDGLLSGYTTTNGGHISQIASSDITVAEAVSAGDGGNVHLNTSGLITLSNQVVSGSGSIQIQSGSGVTQAAAGDIQTGGAGTVFVDSSSPLTMADGAETVTGGGDIFYRSGSDITVGRLDAGNGKVALSTSGNVIDGGDAGGADVTAQELSVQIGAGLGASTDKLETEVAVLEAQAGSIFLDNTGTVTVGPLTAQVSVNQVNNDGTLGAPQTQSLAGTLQSSGGDIVLVADDTITIAGGVSAGATGNILLQTMGSGNVDIFSAVQSGVGHLSLLAADNMNIGSAGSVATAGGTIDIDAGSAVTIASAATVTSGGGNILIVGGTDVLLTGVDAGAGVGSVQVRAGADIVDNGNTNPDITAAAASLVAGNAVGGVGPNGRIETTVADVAAQAGAGGIAIDDTAGGVDIDTVASFNVNRVGMDGMTTAEASLAVTGHTTSANGSIMQLAQAGTLNVNQAVNANGAGTVLLQTATSGDVNVNTTVDSGNGNITVAAADNVSQAAASALSTGSGTIDVTAANGNITMADGAVSASGTGNINYTATGDVTLGSLGAGGGTVTVVADSDNNNAGSIVDGGDTDPDIVAVAAALTAGDQIGNVAATDAIETDVDTIAARAANGISLEDANAVSVGSVAGVNGLSTTASGSIVQKTVNGDLTVDTLISAGGTGNVLLQTQTGGDVIVNDMVSSVGGDITALAADGVQMSAAGSVFANAGTIDVEAQNGSVFMADNAILQVSGGNNIRVVASGDATLGTLATLLGGDVSVIAGGDILDGDEPFPEIAGGTVRLEAGGSIGTASDKLDIDVSTLAAVAGDGIYIDNNGAVAVDDVGPIAVNRVGMDGTTSVVTDTALSDLTTTNSGNIVLVANDSITINDGTVTADGLGVNADGAGNVLLMTMGVGDVTLNAGVQSGAGSISLLGADNVILATADADVTTGGGTIDLEAGTGTIDFQDAGATLTSGGGNINLQANTDLTLTGIDAGAGTVTVTSVTGSILDGGDTVADITADAAALSAANAVGDLPTMNSIDTDVADIAAEAGAGGISLADVDDVTITEVSGSGVNRVLMDGSTSTLTASVSATGLVTSAGGSIVAQSGGNITVDELVDADGAGNVLIEALPGTVNLNTAGIESDSGHITIQGGIVQQQADGDITTGGAGTILVEAGSGTITMADGAVSQTAGGDIYYQTFGSDITVGSLNAGAGDVGIIASGGNVIDGGDLDVDVAGTQVFINAGAGAVGTTADKLDLQAATVAARAGSGGMYLDNDGALAVDEAQASVLQVAMDGTIGGAVGSGDSDLVTTSGGNIVLTANGTISVNDGTTTADGIGVNADGTGNVLLMTSSGDIAGDAIIQSGSGNLSLDAANNVDLTLNGDLTTTGAGTIDVLAGTDVTMADGTDATTGSGNIRVEGTAGMVTLGGLATAGDVAVIAGGDILDGGDVSTDIAAANVLLDAGATVGDAANQLDLQAGVLAAQAVDGIFVDELSAGGALEVGSVTFAGVERVAMDGTTATAGAASDTGLETTADGAIVATVQNGLLSVTEAVSANGAGNVLLRTVSSGDISLAAAVDSGSGTISVRSIGAVDQLADGDITTGGGTIDVEAQTPLTMADGAVSSSGGGPIRYVGFSDITLGSLDAGTGSVYIESGTGGILDGGDTDVDILGGEAALVAVEIGDVSAMDTLETSVDTIAAFGLNGIALEDTDDVTLNGVAAFNTDRTQLDGSTANVGTTAVSVYQTVSANASIVQKTVDGDITVDTQVRSVTSGNILLQTQTGGDIILNNAGVDTTDGSITLLAAGSVNQTATGDIVASGTGSVDVEATGGTITMADMATATAGGNILYRGDGDVTLGGLTAAAGDVHVRSATGSILDGGDTDVDVTAVNASFQATNGGVGALASMGYLETEVDVVAAEAGSGGIALADASAVSIGSVAAVSVNRVQMDGTTVAQTSDAVDGHSTTSAGSIAQKTTGNLTADSAVAADGAGNVLLQAQGGGAMILNTIVQSDTGNLTALSDDGMNINASASLSTGGGDVVIEGGDGIVMQDGATVASSGGNIRMRAVGTDAVISGVNAGSGDVAIDADGAISDAGDSNRDVVASAARLEAGFAVGDSANKLETTVDTLAANAGMNGMFIDNMGAVAVDAVGPVSAQQVQMDGTASAVDSGGDLSDLVTGSNGDLVLVASGAITVNDGTDGDMVGVAADGTGDVLLQTTAGNVDLTAAVTSGSGNLSVSAAASVRQLTAAADITTAGGTIDVLANSGSIDMDSGAAASTGGGTIRYAANTDANLGLLDAGTGDISVVAATGAIRDAGDVAAMNLIASDARLQAATGVGNIASGEYLETTLDTVAAQTGTGGIALMETDALTIGTVGPMTVQRVDMTGGIAPVMDGPMSGYTASAGNVETITLGGDLTVDDVIASGSGKVYLSAEGAGADLTINAPVSSAGGNVILRSADHLTLDEDVTALMDIALWADTDFNNVGDITQNPSVIEAQQGDMFVAGVNLAQLPGNTVMRAPQGTIVMTVTNDIRLSSTTTTAPGFGLQAQNVVMEANNIFVNTTVSADDVFVMNARAGDILHETAGLILGGTIGLVATGDIGQNGNPIQVASSTPGQLFFLGTFADNSEFVSATGNTSSGLLIPADFYPDNGPEWAEAIPRPFSDPVRPDQDVLEDFLNEKIEADVVLQIVVNGDLIGGDLLAGQNAQVVVTGNVDLNRIKVTGNLDGTIAGNFIVDNLMVGSLDLSVGGFGIVDEFMVDNFANATFGGDLSGNNMTIGGPLNLNVGGSMNYGTVTLGSATDTITIGGSATIGSLSDAGSLNLNVGGSYAGGSLSVANTLNATIGNNVDLGTLSVGTLNMSAGGNGTIDSFTVSQNANATFGGNLSGGSMSIGGTTDLKVGGSWDYDSVSFGGDANVMVDGDANVNTLDASQNLIAMVGGNATVGDLLVGGNFDGMIGSDFSGTSLGVSGTTLLDVGNNWTYEAATFGSDAEVMVGGDATVGDLMASQNLMAMVGNNFMGTTFDVGNDATLDVGNDWMYDTVNVGGTLDATVGGQTKVTDFTANTMILNSGSAQINTLNTSGNSTAVIGGDMSIDTGTIGGDADWTTAGNLDLVQLQINGSLLASVDDALTFEELAAGSVEIGAGSINLGRLTTGGASISAGGAINNNGAFINASTLSMTAGGNIGGNSPISMNVGAIQTVSGGGNVAITQLKAGETPIGLLRAGGTLVVDVPNGGLVDANGPDLNIVSGSNSEFNAQFLGTVADALEVEIGGSLLVDGAGLTGEDPSNQARVFVNVVGDIVGDARRIQYIGDVAIPGLIFLNGQLLLGDQFLLLEVARTEAFVVETPEIKSPQGVFGDPYFIHLYMQISEAWNLFLDFILFGEAQVNADPEMPPDAKRTIKIGGTEKPYAR